MANLTYSLGLETSVDWRAMLLEVLENAVVPDAADDNSITLTSLVTGTTIVLHGIGISADSNAFTAGSVDSMELHSGLGDALVLTVDSFGLSLDTVSQLQPLLGLPDDNTTWTGIQTLLSLEPNSIQGSNDSETLYGGDNDDNIHGGGGNDTIYGGNGSNFIEGGDGNDSIFGGNDDDFVEGSTGSDTVDGGSGNGYDNLMYHDSTGGIVVNKDDRLGGTVTVASGNEAGTTTFTNIEIVVGSNSADTFNGSSDDDDFTGDDGADTFNGGDGRDTVVYEKEQYAPGGGATKGIIVNLSDDPLTGYDVGYGVRTVAAHTARDAFDKVDTLNGIERIVGTIHDDVIVGGAESNQLQGNEGDDLLIGGDSPDNDGNGYDGGAGDDTIIGGDHGDYMQGGSGNDRFDGGNGYNTIAYNNDQGISQGVVFDWNVGLATDGYGDTDTFTQWNISEVDGSQQADVLIGNSDDNHFEGFAGEDTILGGGGEDQVLYRDDGNYPGGDGNVLVVLGGDENASGDDVLYDDTQFILPEGLNAGGDDTDGSIGDVYGYAIDGFGHTDRLTSIEDAKTGNGYDTIYGSNAHNDLQGGGGNDHIYGRGGDDYINGGAGDDTVDGGDGDDYFEGGVGADSVLGGRGNDRINFSNTNNPNHSSDSAQFTLTGSGGTVTGDYWDDDQNSAGSLNTTFTGLDTFQGTVGDDSFTVNADFVSDRDRDWRTFNDFRDAEGTVLFVGGRGSDTFTDNGTTDAPYGVAVLGYSDEFYSENDLRNFGVFINLSSAAKSYVGYDHDGSAPGADSLTGSDGDNDTVASGTAIDTFGNLDHINGVSLFDLTNADDVFFGRDMDTQSGGDRGEYVQGNDGNDYIVGGNAADELHGDQGNDTLIGGDGADNMDGSDGNDSMLGGNGAEHMGGGQGDDNMSGEAGRDNMNGDDGNDTMDGGADMDRLWGGQGDDELHGGDGVDQLEGENDNDHVYGDAGDDSVNGGDGNDFVYGDTGADRMRGDSGNDVLYGDDRETDGTAVQLQNGVATNGGADRLEGDDGNDTLYGGYGNDTLDGGDGNDVLYGGAGNDSTDAGSGNDSVFGGDGGDNLHGGDNDDVIDGGAGNDNVYGDFGNDTLKGSAGLDNYYGYLGNDTYDLGAAAVGNLFDGDNNGDNAGTDTVLTTITRDLRNFGGVENATMQALGAGSLTGNELNNTLDGSLAASANVLTGLGGNDTYIVGAGDTINETVAGSSGTDLVKAFASFTLSTNVENLTLMGSGAINGTGNGGGNLIIGNANINVINGAGGTDNMQGGAGNDTYVVDNVGDIVNETANGGAGTDTVQTSIDFSLVASAHVIGTLENLTIIVATDGIDGTGNASNNIIIGGAGTNRLDGGAGNDNINGGADNDTLVGGAGNDTLTGGANNDFFLFNVAPNATTNLDTIADFNAAADTIQLENGVMAGLGTTLGTLAAAKFWASTTGLAHDADDRILYETDTGKLFYDSNGNAAGGAVQIAVLTGHPTITNADFVIV